MKSEQFRDRCLKLINMDRTNFSRLFYEVWTSSGQPHPYIDEKYEKFKRDPLGLMLTLDQYNFSRVTKFLMEEDND